MSEPVTAVWIIEGDPFWCPLVHGDGIPADEQAAPGFLEQARQHQPYWSAEDESARPAASPTSSSNVRFMPQITARAFALRRLSRCGSCGVHSATGHRCGQSAPPLKTESVKGANRSRRCRRELLPAVRVGIRPATGHKLGMHPPVRGRFPALRPVRVRSRSGVCVGNAAAGQRTSC
jgi:hypothetical protein